MPIAGPALKTGSANGGGPYINMLLIGGYVTMRDFDFSPLFRSAIGFDRFPSLVDAALRTGESDGYPPYNIEKADADSYRITMAVAGFTTDDLNVEVRDGVLIVKGAGAKEDGERKYLHRGIARRAFERRFQLADHVEIQSADLVNGLLHVDLRRELPEAMKPRTIQIGSTATAIEGKKAA